MTHPILEEAQKLQPQTVAVRREIHRYPELGLDLPRTRAAVLDSLSGLNLEINLSKKTSGIVATLRGEQPGPSIVLRGDMDALPMTEDTGLEFASKESGRMHSCGHDAHTAMLASAARLLHLKRDRLAGSVRFMFQPGEEGWGGAKIMLEEGLLDAGDTPKAVFALHVLPEFPAGTIGCRTGPILAAADTILARIIGHGGHGSAPHEASDPIPPTCEIVQAIQTFITRQFSVFDPVVATVGRIQAGTTNNIIPEFSELDITLRSLSSDSRDQLSKGIQKLINQITIAHGLSAEITLKRGYPPTINHESGVSIIKNTAEALLGEDGYIDMPEPLMASEDFSYVLQQYPGAFAFLGVGSKNKDKENIAPCHSNRMMIDEDAMAIGVAMHAAVAQKILKQET